MVQKALIVDDDSLMLDVMSRYLAGRGFSVITARNGAEGLAALEDFHPDIIVTDAEMPGMDGFAFCRKLKASRALARIPVIIMSGKKTAEADLVSGYQTGADDYIIKPFSYPILLAKIAALIRRGGSPPAAKPAMIKKHGFELDPGGRTLKVTGRPVRLTSKEMDLFSLLISRPGQIFSLNKLLETVWGYDPAKYNNPHTVEVHISNLRKKVGKKLSSRIIAVAGHGYKFE